MGRQATGRRARREGRHNKLTFECLEDRRLLAVQPFPLPLTPAPPPGAVVYTASATGAIDFAGESEVYTINLDAGQSFTALTRQVGSDLDVALTARGPSGAILDFANRARRGGNEIVRSVPVSTAGTYSIVVAGDRSTRGSFQLDLLLNATTRFNEPINDSPQVALALDPWFESLGVSAAGGRPAQRVTVLQDLANSSAEGDWYRFTLRAGESTTLVSATSDGATGPVLELYAQDAGTLYTRSLHHAGTGHVIKNFVNPVQGPNTTTFFVRAVGATTDYSLVVTRNADFDTEDNAGAERAQELAPAGVVSGHLTSGFSSGGSTGPSGPVSLTVNRIDGEGFLWDIAGGGSIIDGTSDAFDGGLVHVGFPIQAVAESEESGREIVLGPALIGDVEVSRKVYVSDDQGFARFLEIVTNTTDVTQSYTVPIDTNLGSDGGTVLVSESSGDGVFDTTDNWIITDDFNAGGDPTILHVIAGEGALRPAAASAPTGSVRYAYDLTLAPGETQIVMHFAAQSSTQAAAALKANALVELGLGTTAGMTVEEARLVVNFASGDEDFYRFRAQAGDDVTLTVAVPGGGPFEPVNQLDPSLEIISPSGGVVAHVNAPGPEAASFQASETGAYTVRLFGAGSEGEYLLSLQGATAGLAPFEVVSTFPADGAVLPSAPSELRVTFSDILRLDTIDAADLVIDGAQVATGVTQLDERTLLFDLPSGFGEGLHTFALAQGSLRDLQDQPLEAFSATLEIDQTPPRIISSSLQPGQNVPTGTLAYTVVFDEPLDASQLDAADLLLTGELSGSHTPATFNYSPVSSRLTVTYDDLPDDLFTLTLFSGDGGFEDLAGNDLDGELALPGTLPSGDGAAGGDFVLRFGADRSETGTFPTPLEAQPPLGSLIYDPVVTGAISTPLDVDAYAIAVDAGQTITTLLDAMFRSDVFVFGPAGNLVGSALGAEPGASVVLQTAPAGVAGDYEVIVRAIGGDVGVYEIGLTLNAALELESHGGPTNDTPATAQNLSQSFIPLSSRADRGAVLGALDEGESADWHRFDLAPEESASLAVTALSAGRVGVDLFDGDGTTLLAAGVDAVNSTQVINNFVNPSRGRGATYFARVSRVDDSTAAIDYSLVVTRNADFDTEANNDSDIAQIISGVGAVLGHVSGGAVATGQLGGAGSNGAPRAAILGGATTPGFFVPEQPGTPLPSVTYLAEKGVVLGPSKESEIAPKVDLPSSDLHTPAALTQIAGPLPILQQFPGPDSTGSIPPDPTVAAGPEQIVTMVNTDIAVYNKTTGALLFRQSLNGPSGFFGSVGATRTVFDPWVLFDYETQRFFAIGIDIASSVESNMYVAVSTDATPTSGADWHKYKIDFTSNPPANLGSGAHFPDYPKLGINGDALFISSNYFAIDAGNGVYAGITAIEKEPLLTGGPANILYDEVFAGFSVFPMTQYDDGRDQFFAEANFSGGSSIRIHRIANVLTNPVRTVETITVPGFDFPSDVPQLGGGTAADSIDNRIMTGVLRDGSMWLAHAIEDPAIGDGEAVVRWYQVDVTGPAPVLVQSGNIDPGPGVHAWMPAVAVDGNNNLGIGFALGGPNEFLGAGFTGRLASDPPGDTILPVTQYAFGQANYVATDGGGRNRWGDYTGISIDPVDDATFWVFNEYAGTSNRWRTEVAAFLLQDPIDDDWYAIEVAGGDELTLSLTTPGGGPREFVNLLEGGIELFDASGALVGSSEGPSDVTAFVAPGAGGEWRVRVYGANETAGEYVLHVAGASGGSPAPRVIDTDPDAGATSGEFPLTYSLDFSETLLATSVDASDLVFGGLPALGVTAIDGDTYEFAIDPAANVGDGLYEVTLAAGSVFDLQGVAAEAFSTSFTLDTTGPIITSTLWNGDPYTPVLAQGPLTFEATFNEDLFQLGSARRGPFSPAGDDILLVEQVTGESFLASDVTYDAQTDRFTAVYDFLPEGQYQLRLVSGDLAFEDLVGNDLDGEPLGPGLDGAPTGDGVPGGDYVATFIVDRTEQTPLLSPARLEPLGGLISQSAGNVGLLSSPDDRDEFRLPVQAGQTLAALVTPLDPGVRLSVEYAGAVYTGPAAGEPVVLPATLVDSSSVAEIIVSGDAPGRYVIDVLVNAAVESPPGGVTLLDPSAISTPGIDLTGGRFAAVGSSRPIPVGDGRLFATIVGDLQGILELDPVDGSVINRLAAPTDLRSDNGLAFDGQRLFLRPGSSSATLYELDPDTGAVVDVDFVTGTGVGLAMLAGRVWAVDLATDDLIEFDPVADRVTRTLDIDGLNPGVRLSGGLAGIRNPGELVVTLASGEIALVDPATGLITERLLPDRPISSAGLAVLGGEIYVAAGRRANNIDVYTRDGEHIRSFVASSTLSALGADDPATRPIDLSSEPNDTIPTAVLGLLGPGDDSFTQSGFLGDNPNLINSPNNDVDLVEIVLAAGDRVVIDIDASLIGSPLDPILTLFNSAGDIVAQNDDFGSLDSFIDATVLASGSYFVGVSSFANFDYDPFVEGSGFGGSSGPYDLQIDVTRTTPSPPTPSPPTPTAPQRFVPEEDRYAVDLAPERGAVDIVLAGQAGVDFSGGQIELLDAAGAVVATGSPGPLGPTATNFDLAILNFLPAAAGTYTIRVTSLVAGDYGLVVTAGAVFEAEPNNSLSTQLEPLRRLIGASGTTSGAALGYLGGRSDRDRYELTLAAGDLVTLSTTTPFDDPSGAPLNELAPLVTVANPQGGVFASDSGSAPDGRNARLSFVAEEGGSFAVTVITRGTLGEYTLHAQIADPIRLPGDYNDDGVVDSIDYAVWRTHLETSTLLPGDATPGVTTEDLQVWRDNFGARAEAFAAWDGPSD